MDAQAYAHYWRPEEDVDYLTLALSAFYLETGSHTGPKARVINGKPQ